MEDAISQAESWGLQPKELRRQVFRKHIFTHIQWDMKGIYLEVADCGSNFQWMTPNEIDTQAALPTAFRQFWEEEEHV